MEMREIWERPALRYNLDIKKQECCRITQKLAKFKVKKIAKIRKFRTDW